MCRCKISEQQRKGGVIGSEDFSWTVCSQIPKNFETPPHVVKKNKKQSSGMAAKPIFESCIGIGLMLLETCAFGGFSSIWICMYSDPRFFTVGSLYCDSYLFFGFVRLSRFAFHCYENTWHLYLRPFLLNYLDYGGFVICTAS